MWVEVWVEDLIQLESWSQVVSSTPIWHSTERTPSPFSMPSNRPESGVKQQDQPAADLMEFPFFSAEVKPNVKSFLQGVVERRGQRLVV